VTTFRALRGRRLIGGPEKRSELGEGKRGQPRCARRVLLDNLPPVKSSREDKLGDLAATGTKADSTGEQKDQSTERHRGKPLHQRVKDLVDVDPRRKPYVGPALPWKFCPEAEYDRNRPVYFRAAN